MKRKDFIKTSLISGTGLLISNTYLAAGLKSKEWETLTILHTNDMHSNIDPFPKGHPKYPGMGGFERRAALINHIRRESNNVILLDAGDVFQGSPYFNFYGGELEFKGMSMMGYDAVTIGNHDFDNGIEGLHKMIPHASFKFINSNYDLSGTVIHNQIIPHKLFQKGRIKIGVFGLGVELEGLVDPKLYGEAKYLEPVKIANKKASFLKNEMNCDVVICLSHLGYEYKSNKISDLKLAALTQHIDLIIGGHTHTFLDKPRTLKNLKGKPVLVNQVGWAGLRLGRIELAIKKEFNENKSAKKIIFFHKKNILV